MSQYHKSGRYSRSGRQTFQKKAKPKIPPIPAKPCVVRLGGQLMFWNVENKVLEYRAWDVGGDYYTRFPSRRKAKQAIWHTSQKAIVEQGVNGREYARRFEMVEAK